MNKFGQSLSPSRLERFQFHQSSFGQELLAILCLCLTLAVLRFDAITRLDTALIGGAEHDAGLYFWLVRSNAKFMLGGWKHLFWFDTPAFYPYGETLAWSDNFFLPSLFFLLLKSCGISEILSYNLILLTAGFLNGYCVYRLAIKLTGDFPSALFAGAAFLSLAFFTAHLGHPQLQFAFWLPLGIGIFFRFLNLPNFWRALLWGVSISGAFLTTVYYSIFLGLSCGIILVLFLVRGLEFIEIRSFCWLLPGTAAGLLPLAAVIPSYLKVRAAFGERHLYEAAAFAAKPLSYLSAPDFSLMYSGTAALSHNEAQLFSGVLIMLLSALSIGYLARRKLAALPVVLTIASLSGMVILGSPNSGEILGSAAALCSLIPLIVLASGPLLLNKGTGASSGLVSQSELFYLFFSLGILAMLFSFGPLPANSSIPDLYRLIYRAVPGVDSIRATGRAGVVVMFSSVILSSLILAEFRHRIPRSLPMFLIAAVVLENYCTQYPIESPRPASAAFKTLENMATDSDVVAVLPFSGSLDENGKIESWTKFSEINTNAMNWLLEGEASTINGYSGQRSWIIENFPRWLAPFPSHSDLSWERALSQIAGLRYLVYTPEFAENYDRESLLSEASKSESLKFILDDEAGNLVFEFKPEILLRPEYQLLVPSNRDHKAYVHYELRSKDAGKIDTEVALHLGSIATPPFAVSELHTDQTWQTFSAELPIQTESVKPQRIFFSVSSGTVLMRSPKYQLYR